MPFDNPVVGGNTLIRAAIRSPNYQQGLLGWAINQDGSAEFNNLSAVNSISAAQSFYYKGVELSSILSQFSMGIVGLMWLNTSAGTRPVVFPGEHLMMQTQFTWHTGKRYFLYFDAVRAQNTTVDNLEYVYRARPAANGNVVLTDPPGRWLYEKRFWNINVWDGVGPVYKEITGYINSIVADGQQMNIAISVTGSSGTATFFQGDDWTLAVVDAGYDNPNIGVDMYTSPTTPSLTYKTFQTNAPDSQSYIGSGAASLGSGVYNSDRMYFGEDPGYSPNGNWKSLAWFNKADTSGGNGLGSLNDMNGVSAANVNYLDVWIETPWWYYTSGGRLRLGVTGSAANHVSYPSGTADIVEAVYTSRGQGQWISVKGSSIATAILNGSFTGIQLGPGQDTSFGWYGYAYGGGHAGSGGPAIRAGYYK